MCLKKYKQPFSVLGNIFICTSVPAKFDGIPQRKMLLEMWKSSRKAYIVKRHDQRKEVVKKGIDIQINVNRID